MPTRKVRPEQLGWNLVENLVMTASGNYFAFDETGSMFIEFKGINNNKFSIQRQGNVLFEVNDDGTIIVGGDISSSGNFYIGENLFVTQSAYIGGNLFVSGNIYGNFNVSGNVTNASTASHLEEQGVAIFAALGSTPGYISGGIFYSSSGDWFLS
jgi:hypothetical protein